jgi:hypothetical protein
LQARGSVKLSRASLFSELASKYPQRLVRFH